LYLARHLSIYMVDFCIQKLIQSNTFVIFMTKQLIIQKYFKPCKLTFFGTILFSIVAILSLSSCSKFQYVSIASHLEQSPFNGFIVDNDSVTIKYNFKGRNCPIAIEVYNKLTIPIYIDWRKSSAIIDGRSISYWKDQTNIDASSQSVEIQWNSIISTNSTQLSGTMSRNESTSFVPPQSSIKMTPLLLKSAFFNVLEKDSVSIVNVPTASKVYKAKRYIYNESNTPLLFRSYLTMSLSDDFQNAHVYDHKFWVDGIIPFSLNPETIEYSPDNQFYMQETTEGGRFMGTVALIGLVGVGIAVGGE